MEDNSQITTNADMLMFMGFSGFTQRLDNVANLIQQKFGIEIDALVYGESNFNYLRNNPKASYRSIDCVEHILRAAPSAVDENSVALKNWEQRLGYSLTHLLYSERTFVQHTHTMPIRRRLSHAELIAHLLYLLDFIDAMLDGKRLVFVYTCASLISEILYYLSISRGIPFLTMNEQRIGYRWSLCANNMDSHEEMLALYRNPEFAITEAGRRRFQNYKENLIQRKRNAIEQNYQREHLIRRRLTVRNIFDFVRRSMCNRKVSRYYLAPTRKQQIAYLTRFKYRERFCRKIFKASLPERPFVYFPLTLIPEASTLIRGLKHCDQLGLIKRLSLELPVNWVLLVREHPSAVGNNPVDFYRELGRIFNVSMVSTDADPMSCILGAEAVVTVTGTSGMESLALGKKTLVLGSAIYSQLDSVFAVDEISQVGDILRRPWSRDDVARQELDMARFTSAMEEGDSFEDSEGILWTKAAFNPDLCPVDTSLYEALKPHLIDIFEGSVGASTAKRR